ncbi:MAG TPA: RNA polymerase sigma factor [Candidatus Polarisedimenticolaceae bacterium]|nr:RNA polymerase sigma factor [Candidatus Polarisedimenticolaceae bacterium]
MNQNVEAEAGRLGREGSASAADLALVAALRRGDETAFARLVEEHHASLRRIARLYLSSAAVADEVVQDTWLGVIQGVWAFEGRSSLKTWILRILTNRAKTRALHEGRTAAIAGWGTDGPEGPGDVPGSAPSPPLRDPAPSPEASLLAQETSERFRSAIAALPPKLKLVLTMRDVEGSSSAEVRNVLGITETNQRVLLHRARRKVRTALRAYVEGA